MLIPSDQIPQADNLSDVILTIIGVSEGHRTYQAIAQSIDKVERQGRYYRKAAEIIGLITTNNNNSILTALGQEFITDPTITNPIFIRAIINIGLFQRLIPFLESNSEAGLTRQNIIDFIIRVSELTAEDTMAARRVSSVISWLEDIRIVEKRENRFYLLSATINDNIELLNFTNIDEPILPRTGDLNEYEIVQERSNNARETIISYRDSAALDRADNAHRRLVNLLAQRIKQAGQIPRYNQLVDLATRYNGKDFIFEMKSITDTNARKQVRNGLSQLYEYQYLQNLPGSNLVLVIERDLPQANQWMVEYLEQNRNINLIWDGDDNLYGTETTRAKFEFLNLLPR